jgi:TRAP transporter TAXI family solute receptor
MIKKSNKLFISLLFATALLCDLSSATAATKYINIATGNITGVYYPAGGAICRLVNIGRKDHGIRCSGESTGGSVANLNSLRKGTTDLAIVQSDWQYHAYNGTGFFADQPPFKDLRSILSLYTETFAVAVLENSGIKKINDVVGKTVNFGPQGSGMYATMEVLSKIKGWDKSSFAAITNLDPSTQVKALCDGKIDVMIYTSGNPNGVLQEATQNSNPNCRVKILNIDKESIDKLIKLNPYYVKAIIPGGMYRGNPDDIVTFGVKATLVASSKVSDDVVYNVTKAVFSDLENFKTLHPVFSTLNKKESIKDGNSAPLHPGATRYYKEAGLL